MKPYKKILSLFLAIVVLTALCACGVKDGWETKTDNTTTTTSTTSTKTTSTTTSKTTTSTKTTSSTTSKTTTNTTYTRNPGNEDFEVGYQEDGTFMITKYIGTSAKVVVPEKINGEKVVAVGSWTFRENTTITEVVIPDSIRQLHQNLFINCTNLEKVTLPKEVDVLGDQIFDNCPKLKRVVLPDGIEVLGYRTFGRCTGLEEVVLPAVTKFETQVFSGATNLKTIYYRGTSEQWAAIKKSIPDTTKVVCNYTGK